MRTRVRFEQSERGDGGSDDDDRGGGGGGSEGSRSAEVTPDRRGVTRRDSPPRSASNGTLLTDGASFSAFLDTRLREIEAKYRRHDHDHAAGDAQRRFDDVRERYLLSFEDQLRSERARRDGGSGGGDGGGGGGPAAPAGKASSGIHRAFSAHMQGRLVAAHDSAVAERSQSVRGLTKACLEDIESSAEELHASLAHEIELELTAMRQRGLADMHSLLLDVRRQCERERQDALELAAEDLQAANKAEAQQLRAELREQADAEVEDLRAEAEKRLGDEKRKLLGRAAERRTELDAQLEAEHSAEVHAAEFERWRKELEAEVEASPRRRGPARCQP